MLPDFTIRPSDRGLEGNPGTRRPSAPQPLHCRPVPLAHLGRPGPAGCAHPSPPRQGLSFGARGLLARAAARRAGGGPASESPPPSAGEREEGAQKRRGGGAGPASCSPAGSQATKLLDWGHPSNLGARAWVGRIYRRAGCRELGLHPAWGPRVGRRWGGRKAGSGGPPRRSGCPATASGFLVRRPSRLRKQGHLPAVTHGSF